MMWTARPLDPSYAARIVELADTEGMPRAELARSVVNSGWNLSELRAVGLSLEDIFLQLTTVEPKEDGDKK